MKDFLLKNTSSFTKNVLITIYNLRLKKWHGKKYHNVLKNYNDIFFNKSRKELLEQQEKRFIELIKFVRENNDYYKDKFKNIEIKSINDLDKLPILEKNDLRDPSIISKINDKLITNFTGGTTGVSLKNYFTIDDVQERHATLDFFRGLFGYKFGSKTAWFSGKNLLNKKDLDKNIYWVKDYLNHINYYSTFHMKPDFIDYMIEDMNKSKIEYFVGFPSAIYAVAKRIKSKNIKIEFELKAIFPTSEPLLEYQKELLIEVFNCPVPNQYASSEGAPFIYECPHGNLHYDMYSGIFERRYPNTESNEVLVTAFPTHSMPLIRYAIGDSVEFDDSDTICSCGSQMPLVKNIEGRRMTFVYSKERGIVGAGNISNIVKYTPGIDKIQVIQNSKDNILVKIVTENDDKNTISQILENELRNRLGNKINLNFEFVDEIANEKSGKFIMIKNSLSIDECL